MKTVVLLLMAMLAVETASAQGQDACTKSYIACVDKCVAKPSQTLQESCIGSCQGENNACSARAYGGANVSTAKTVTPEEAAQREEAEAKAKSAKPAKAAKPARQVAEPAKPTDRRPQ